MPGDQVESRLVVNEDCFRGIPLSAVDVVRLLAVSASCAAVILMLVSVLWTLVRRNRLIPLVSSSYPLI